VCATSNMADKSQHWWTHPYTGVDHTYIMINVFKYVNMTWSGNSCNEN